LALAPAASSAAGQPTELALRSSAFEPAREIPTRYTCEGEDVSPPLAWGDPPAGTRSFALIVDDPDAPDPKAPLTTWVHWVVYDLPADLRALPEGAGAGGLPPGARSGVNDWKRADYGGPCPSVGRHRYFFELYALDVTLGELGQPGKAGLERAMQGHVLARGELMGTYAKRGGGGR
jgi:Raf kinase inhibitor-like YbhB/YbcL family protein